MNAPDVAAVPAPAPERAEQADDDEAPAAPAPSDANATSPTGLSALGQNILTMCASLSSTVREYYRLPKNDQLQVWDDMTGYQGQRRVFVQGKELLTFSEDYEPKAMVEEALKQLPQELERMPSSYPTKALQMVLEKAPDYVLDRDFLLKFLRAEKFDVFAAAVRMCRHFEDKLDLFGPDKLGREIRLDDMDEDDMDSFDRGFLQVLQQEDHGQRPVIFYYKACTDCYKKRENFLRSFWYLLNRVSQQEHVQKLGVCNLVYNNGGFPRSGMDYEKSRRCAGLFLSVPVRFNNFYVCLDDNPWLTVVETFAVMMTRFLRVRLRMLRGTHEQVVEKLAAVGLPADALPVTDQSELLVEPHLQWIQEQREMEQEEKLSASEEDQRGEIDSSDETETNPDGEQEQESSKKTKTLQEEESIPPTAANPFLGVQEGVGFHGPPLMGAGNELMFHDALAGTDDGLNFHVGVVG